MTDNSKLFFNYERAALEKDVTDRLKRGDDPSEILPDVVAHPEGSARAVLDLLQRGANVDAKDRHGMPVLHLAITTSKPDVLVELLKHGANLMARDSLGNSSLNQARFGQKTGASDEVKRDVVETLHAALAREGLPTEPHEHFRVSRRWP